ncbi:MAG: hypothetical protein JRN18_00285 [Nitrososphaerota archaeon]|jgi:hypothetical protein|nr:hypothetical protein [Nitrososphaerota archaeon]
MSAEESKCPRDGKVLVAVADGRYLECFCGYKFDTYLSQEVAEVPRAEVPDDVTAEARAWLKDPSLVGYLADAIAGEGSEKPLLGEDDTAVQMLLTLLAKGSVEIRGQTGAGKNTLADHVLTIFPRDWWRKVGGLTDKSLRYLPEGVKILYVTERRGMESGRNNEETTAEYDVKVGISEGEISVATTERDPETNQFTTTFRKVEIESFVFTTTEVNATPELENRLTVLNVRDDSGQNAIVRDAQLEAAGRFSWEKRDITRIRAVAAQALQIVRDEGPEEAIVPYAQALTPILSVESSVVRRNTPKVLDLVKSSAKLHFLQRERTPDGRGVVAATEDLAIALYTGRRSLAAILSAIPEKAGIVWEICKGIAKGQGDISVENILLNAGLKRPELGSRVTVRKAVRFLADRGVLTERVEREGRAHAKLYDLQAWESPLVIEIDRLLRDADALYTSWQTVERRKTEPITPILDAPNSVSLVESAKTGEKNLDVRRSALPGESTRP